MKWYETIIAAHTAVTDEYFVWQEDGERDLLADNRHTEKAVTGTTDLYTKREFDPWKDQFESSLNSTKGVTWYLNSVQFEEETELWHYEWRWTVRC